MSAITDARLRELLRRGTRNDTDRDNPTPPISKLLLEWMEEVYPPKCYDPSLETMEQHLLYAGRVSLVQDLRVIHDRQRDEAADDTDPYPAEAPVDWEDAERAGGPN